MIDNDLIIKLPQEEILTLKQMVSRQQRMFETQGIINRSQAQLIILLKTRVNDLENNQKKHGSNSSKPPSTDIAKPNSTQSLGTQSGTKPGGQPGYAGERLLLAQRPIQ